MFQVAILGCSRQTEPELDGTSPRLGVSQPPSNPLNRTNPLRTYIQDNWTSGDPDLTGGTHYSHIKIYGHNYKNARTALTNHIDYENFVANHYDMYHWGGPYMGSYRHVDNGDGVIDDFIWTREATRVPHIGHDPDEGLPNGFEYDDVVMHYKKDVTYHSCFDSATILPGCTNQSPSCMVDARFYSYCCCWDNIDTGYRALLKMPEGYQNREDFPYLDFVVTKLAMEPISFEVDGFFFDEVSYVLAPQGAWYQGFDKTFAYAGEDEYAYDFSYIADKYAFVPWAVYELESEVSSGELIGIANTVQPDQDCVTDYQDILSQTYLENILNELWMGYGGSAALMTTSRIECWLQRPYTEYLEQDKGYIFCCYDMSGTQNLGSDKGREFSLATFYMINHQMAFYYYRTRKHFLDDSTPPVERCHWNPLVQLDVGQPTVNMWNIPDYEQNISDRFFIYEQGPDYQILGREFLRDDEYRVLVLTKIMDNMGVEGLNETTVDLPYNYYRLEHGETWNTLSWGPITNQISLCNNEGAILIRAKKGDPEPPPDPNI